MNKESQGAFGYGPADASETLHDTRALVHKALCVLGLGTDAYDLLGLPKSVLSVRFPVTMDDGAVRVFTGHRSQHNNSIGLLKGGIRFSPNATETEIEASSIWMSVKSGIANMPFGGSKGAVVCNPRELSFGEIERVSRAYIRAISQVIGLTKDIPAPDGLANAQNMAWMVDEFGVLSERSVPMFMSGKPLVLGGTHGRDSVTTKGIFTCLSEAAKVRNMSLHKARIIIQGFGNVGSSLCQAFDDAGATIVGISDAHGALYNPEGLDIKELMERRDSFGTVTRLYQNQISMKELLASICDIMIFTNFSEPLPQSLCESLQATMVVEATNQFITNEQAAMMHKKGILFIPEILANLGGSIISYLEWVQNRDGYYLTATQVVSKMADLIQSGYLRVYDVSEKNQVDLRLSSYIVGIGRLAQAAKLRAWI
jgi:glutamate dehydrogenase